MTSHSQSGNALWYILIVIVLLGGLTALMSRTSETTEDTGDFERTQIQATEISRFAKSLEMAVQTLQGKGCSENDLNFEATGVGGSANPGAPADDSCDLYNVKGAGLNYREIPEGARDPAKSAHALFGDWVVNGTLNVPFVGGDAGAAGKELLIIAPFVTRETCLQLNTLAGVSNPAGEPPQEDDVTAAFFTAQYTGSFSAVGTIDAGGNGFDYKTSGCVRASNEASYYYYQVLISR